MGYPSMAAALHAAALNIALNIQLNISMRAMLLAFWSEQMISVITFSQCGFITFDG